MQVLHGKALYRDLWYDKPPLNVAAYYAAFGAAGGACDLRLASAIYALIDLRDGVPFRDAACGASAKDWIAAPVSPRFSDFLFSCGDHHSGARYAFDPAASVGRVLRVAKAFLRRGFVAGIAMLLNVKPCLCRHCAVLGFGSRHGPRRRGWRLVFDPQHAGIGGLQGRARSRATSSRCGAGDFVCGIDTPLSGAHLPAGWAGRELGGVPPALIGGGVVLVEGARWRRGQWIAWTALSFAGAAVGWRFLPRYLDQLLPTR